MSGATDRVVLIVELPGGEAVAVPFDSREAADKWEERHRYEVLGRPRQVSARSLSVGERMRERGERS